MSFADLGLKSELSRAVAEKGYVTATPIQSQAIPAVLAGRDVLAGAQTGTGKTAAFVLPILQKLGRANGRQPRALILTPTRELAAQVAESARTYGKYLDLRTTVVFGGVSINPQIDALRAGCDLLVATPGRLLDLADQRALDLRSVECFVLDEADRMLDMGFIRAIRQVLKLLPPQRQNLMFSATYSDEIRELASRFLREPAAIEVAVRNATADRVDQQVYRVSKEDKRHLLAHLIDSGNWHQVLVFTRTKHGANRLAQQLESYGIRAAAIHGNKSQGARVRALSDFKTNNVTALVATEVAARGLDIKELPYVVNYELPNVPEDYVHRIGRTARAGSTGRAVSLVSPDEAPLLRDIERLLRRSLAVTPLPAYPVSTPAQQSPLNGESRPQRRAEESSPDRNGQAPRRERSGGQGTNRQHTQRRRTDGERMQQHHAPRQHTERRHAQGQHSERQHPQGQHSQGQRSQDQSQHERAQGQHSHGQQPRGQHWHGQHSGNRNDGNRGSGANRPSGGNRRRGGSGARRRTGTQFNTMR